MLKSRRKRSHERVLLDVLFLFSACGEGVVVTSQERGKEKPFAGINSDNGGVRDDIRCDITIQYQQSAKVRRGGYNKSQSSIFVEYQ